MQKFIKICICTIESFFFFLHIIAKQKKEVLIAKKAWNPSVTRTLLGWDLLVCELDLSV